jgi:hypothetical protein
MRNKYFYLLVVITFILHGCTYKQQSDIITMNMNAEESVKEYLEESPIDWDSNFMQLISYTVIGLVLISLPGKTNRTRGYIRY